MGLQCYCGGPHAELYVFHSLREQVPKLICPGDRRALALYKTTVSYRYSHRDRLCCCHHVPELVPQTHECNSLNSIETVERPPAASRTEIAAVC